LKERGDLLDFVDEKSAVADRLPDAFLQRLNRFGTGARRETRLGRMRPMRDHKWRGAAAAPLMNGLCDEFFPRAALS
jgi:hypothetical protein